MSECGKSLIREAEATDGAEILGMIRELAEFVRCEQRRGGARPIAGGP